MSNVPVIELLPCPFCGGAPEIRWVDNGNNARSYFEADCPTCDFSVFDNPLETVTRSAWNTRIAATSTLQDQVEAYRALLPFTSHSVGCAIYQRSWASGEPPCTCGLDTARAALTQKDISR